MLKFKESYFKLFEEKSLIEKEKRFDAIKSFIDSYGWLSGSLFGVDKNLLDFSGHEERPKSLKGIEKNNGWIKIESENLILPIDGTEVHFYNSFTNENGFQTEYHKGIFNAALGFTSYYDSENYKINEVTHYQPIEKPKPPIY